MTVTTLPGPVASDPTPGQRTRRATTSWRTVHLDSRQVEVLTIGTGAPVVFLHGWGLSPRSYAPTLAALASHGYRITAPSLPGFGKSDPLGVREQNVHGVARHIIATLEALGHEAPVDVVAHSFGGGVAMRVAALRPDLVGSLTLVCPVGGAGEGAVPLIKMVGGVLVDAKHKWIARAMRDLTGALVKNPVAVAASAYAAWQSDQMQDLALLNDHQIPVRFLFADHDDVVTPGAIPACAYQLVSCEVTAGRHSWLITEPRRFADHVADYLAPAHQPEHPHPDHHAA